MKKINMLMLLITLGLASCVEQVSEEIKNENTSINQEVSYVNKAMRIINNNDSSLSHILHKSGSLSEACELKAPTLGFSSADYDKTSNAYNVDCIIDAQELDLFFSGAKFGVEVDEYLCEYVAYKPYRFLRYQPGSSQKSKYTVTCDDTCASAHQSICDKSFRTTGASFPAISPGSVQTINPAVLTSPALLTDVVNQEGPDSVYRCEFNYDRTDINPNSIAGPNCDSGRLYTNNLYLNSGIELAHCSDPTYLNQGDCEAAVPAEVWTEDTPVCDSGVASEYPTIEWSPAVAYEECAGETINCFDGPGSNDFTGTDSKQHTILYQNTDLNSFKKDWIIESPLSKNHLTNIFVANYSRICSSTSDNKPNANFDSVLSLINGQEVEDMVVNNGYNSFTVDENGDGVTDYTVKGMHMFSGPRLQNIQPYYAVLCLDRAKDVKAQIRVFIRDWDRGFDASNPFIAKLSDINQPTPLMDAYGDQQTSSAWNDAWDIDDLFYDVDGNRLADYDGDADNIDRAFTNDQCTGLDYGYCSNRTYTSQASCELNSEEWKVGAHCTTAGLLTPGTCTGGGGTWINTARDALYPGYDL
ncbi:MAG: hypothetical protein OEW87_10545 [Flavobacteriaceae bacterium]|nr:hypothetical protein [Flavobacteriaceae bacterium]